MVVETVKQWIVVIERQFTNGRFFLVTVLPVPGKQALAGDDGCEEFDLASAAAPSAFVVRLHAVHGDSKTPQNDVYNGE